MKNIKILLKKFDFFGVNFSFRYNNEDKYSTSLGGLFFIVFCVVVVAVGIYYFIPFFNRKNFSIVYYSMNLPNAEQIRLKDSKSAFAIGLDCEVGKDGTKAEDLFNLNLRFYTYRKDKDGNKIKTYEDLTTHPCNYSDFYNNYNDSLDILDMSKFQCLDKTDDVIEGLYTDEVFTYYQFSVSSKEDSVSNFNKIDDYLTSHDCKLTVYYSDITIDIDNYEDPIKPFLNEIFLQINPTLYLKMNVFFMNQYFENDNYLLSVFDEEEPLLKTLFSRIEQYSLYKGLNRGNTKPDDYINYAKIYIRSDTRKTEIKRKYQKVMEFYADASSLLIALYEVLCIIFNFINGFYADHTFTKKLFFFKDVENNHFNFNQKHKQIRELINITEPLSIKTSINSPTLPKLNNIKKRDKTIKETEWIKALQDEEKIIYNNKKLKRIEFKEKEQISTEKRLNGEKEIKEVKKKKNIKIIKNIIKNINLDVKPKFQEKEEIKNNLPSIHINLPRNEMMSKCNFINSKYIIQKNAQEETIIEEQKFTKIKYTYNIFEIIFSSFLFCCISNKLKLKKNITEKANNILYNKLDIVLFVRNMFILDIMNEILINDNNNRKGIMKFLSRPIISEAKKEEEQLNDFYKEYDEKDFDIFYNETSEIVQKSNILEMEKKLISLSNDQLKNLLNN